MNEAIRNIEPKELWNKFADLNAVPRPSKKEEKVIDFMRNFGENLGLKTLVDDIGNVIITKPASSGMEDRKAIVMQSHLDMVHQKNNDTDFDFDKQGITMFVEGDWVKAHYIGESGLQEVRDAFKGYFKYIEDFIEDMKKVFPTLKDDWGVYVPEVKYLSPEPLVYPKDLALALNIEAGELLENYLWKDSSEADVEKVKEELADVLSYAFLLAEKYNFDVKEIVLDKIKLNSSKYPIEKSKGTAKKYNEL